MSQSQSTYPTDIDAFKRVVADFQASAGYKSPLLFAIGSRVFTGNGTLASVRYPVVNGPGQNTGSAAIWMKVLGVTPSGVQNISLSAEQVREILAYFAPFKNDGKSHGNIVALEQALLACQAGPANRVVATFIFDEIDPFNPGAAPIKRTAMGRIKHEGATYTIAADNRVVVYMGDDQAGEYIYKFITKNKYNASNRAANLNLLDEGTLYVAKFAAGAASGDNMGNGQWLELSLNVPVLAANFGTLGDMLANTRKAADLVGATKMDRPEWIAAHPKVPGQIYCTLTNSSSRTTATIDDANPRANNRYGHIIRWNEASGDTAALTFEWDIFVMAGDPSLAANAGSAHVGNINGDTFGSPDGLWFDPSGRLWIQTDISSGTLGTGTGVGGYINMTNNMMLAADTTTGQIKRFLTGPKGCEITGISGTPDGKNLFINIQHPGEGSGDNTNPLDAAYPNKISAWPASQGYYGAALADGDDKKRPRSGTIVITRTDGGEIGA